MDMDKKLYAAYGSNLSVFHMSKRCPNAQIVGVGRLYGYRLLFRGDTAAYATVEPYNSAYVPVLLWEVSYSDEKKLDEYEGVPVLYRKENLSFLCEEKVVTAMAYVMDHNLPLGKPSNGYYKNLRKAYKRLAFDLDVLQQAFRSSCGKSALW